MTTRTFNKPLLITAWICSYYQKLNGSY